MFYLSKILPLFVLPLGLVMACFVIGIVRRQRWLMILGTVIFWISSTPAVSGPLMRSLEGGEGRVLASEMSPADAIVVLSGGRRIAPGVAAVSEWSDADRFFGGIELFRAGKAPLLVFTGGIVGGPRAPLEGETLAQHAREMGLPSAQIVTTGRVVNTAEEAVAVASLLQSRHLAAPRILLVTSAFHMARARRQFERNGMTVVPFVVDFAGAAAGSIGLLHFIPSPGAFGQTHVALREVYGRLYYWLVNR